jgi:hypothetical protein
MATITPQPPGFSVQFVDMPSRRFADPSPANLFAVGFAERGSVKQGAGIAGVADHFGSAVAYSGLVPGLQAAVAESDFPTTWTASRALGPNPVKASVTLSTLTITAKEYGDALNGASGGYAAQILADGANRSVQIREGGTTGDILTTSPSTSSIAELVAWSEDQDYVTVAGASLPIAAAAANLTGGTDDHSNATPATWRTAMDSLDRRYGPGILVVDSTDPDVQLEALEHCQLHNRRARFPLPVGVTQSDAIDQILDLRADASDIVRYGVWIASWAKCRPVAGDPERQVPYAWIDAGIVSRLIRTEGVATPTFGPTAASSLITTGLVSEWTDDQRTALYADGVNVATDDGASISLWGYKTGDDDPLHSDGHHLTVRMGYQFDAEAVLKGFIGSVLDAGTYASLAGKLTDLSAAYVKARAFADFIVDVESVNSTETANARELHARILIKHTPTTDWVDASISVDSI